jgi:triosephosphate isomerase (TIM)
MSRQFFVGGNFKMNPCSQAEKIALVKALNEADLDPSTGTQRCPFIELFVINLGEGIGIEVILAPPSLYLIPLSETVKKGIKVSAQNCFNKNSGAYTGEIRSVKSCLIYAASFAETLVRSSSPTQLANAGIPFVILGMSPQSLLDLISLSYNLAPTIGHSERRTLFHETSELVAEKTRAALDAALSVILCVGETLLERESGQTTAVVESQLKAVVSLLKENDWK